MTQTISPTWFGPPDASLFGVAHIPEGSTARAGVVLCPPLGKEHVNTYRGMKFLAQELADKGFAVLRMEYHGTGDSVGAQVEPNSVEQWIRSVVDAAQWLRDAGCSEIALVGLRAGALLLERASERCGDIAAAVLWDPVMSGRMYLREQQAFYRLSVGADAGGGPVASMIGLTVSDESAAQLTKLVVTMDQPNVKRWLVAVRSGIQPKKTSALIESTGAESIEVDGMAEFVTPDSFLVVIAESAVDHITSWLNNALEHDRTTVIPTIRLDTEFAVAPGGSVITETIESLGPHGIFAIRTHPAVSNSGPKSVVFCATANDTRIGPTRIWVDLARDAAAAGANVLRYDRRGAGESALVTRDEHTPIYSPEAGEDVLTAARAATPDPRQLILAGLCSGSWNAAFAARELGAGSAVLINAIAWSWRRKRGAEGRIDPADLGVPRSDPEWQKTPRARVKSFLQRHLPYPAWRALGKRGITQVPEVMLRTLAERGVDTTVILAPADRRWFDEQRGEEGLARLGRRSNLPVMINVDDGDHSGYHGEVRRAISHYLVGAVAKSVALAGDSKMLS